MKNTDKRQDDLADECTSFGGKAADMVEVAEDLDRKLTEALDKIEELEAQIRETPNS